MNETDEKEFPFADAPDTAAIVCLMFCQIRFFLK